MLQPKKGKHRKQQRARVGGGAAGGGELACAAAARVRRGAARPPRPNNEAGRVALTRHVKRGGKVWIRVFPDKPITKKPAETRMGKGKGNPEEWVAVVKPGRMMFELEGVPLDIAQKAMALAAAKMPVKTTFVV